MTGVEILALVITSGIAMKVLEALIGSIKAWARSRGAIQTEKDALMHSRGYWIEATHDQHRAGISAGVDMPPIAEADAYDRWREKNRPPHLT